MPAFQLFAESFSAYKVADFTDSSLLSNFRSRWTGTTGTCSIDTNGRNGRGFHLQVGCSIFKTLNHSATFTGGFALRIDGIAAPGNDRILTILNNDTQLFAIVHNADGTLSIRAGSGTTIAVSSRALLLTRFYWIDYTVTFSGSAPIIATAELRINTFSEASGAASTGISTSSLLSGATDANVVMLSSVVGTGAAMTVSEFYIKNTSGYYGDVNFIPIYPNGDVITEWTPSTGSSHYVLIKTAPADLTKNINTATINNRDIFDWDDCPGFSGTLKAINIRFLARKDDEGTKSFKIVTGDTGTEDASAEKFVSDVTEEYYEHSLENDPATGLPWTQVGFNAKRFGVKLIS